MSFAPRSGDWGRVEWIDRRRCWSLFDPRRLTHGASPPGNASGPACSLRESARTSFCKLNDVGNTSEGQANDRFPPPRKPTSASTSAANSRSDFLVFFCVNKVVEFDPGSSVTDTDLKHLRRLRHLRWLNLTGTRVTAAGMEALKQEFPEVTIVTDREPPSIVRQ